MVTTSTRASGISSRSRRVAVSPSPPGMSRSITITSGCARPAIVTAICPSPASPTTTMSAHGVQHRLEAGSHERVVVHQHHPDGLDPRRHASARIGARREVAAHFGQGAMWDLRLGMPSFIDMVRCVRSGPESLSMYDNVRTERRERCREFLSKYDRRWTSARLAVAAIVIGPPARSSGGGGASRG
jgi:hypothetical protein